MAVTKIHGLGGLINDVHQHNRPEVFVAVKFLKFKNLQGHIRAFQGAFSFKPSAIFSVRTGRGQLVDPAVGTKVDKPPPTVKDALWF